MGLFPPPASPPEPWGSTREAFGAEPGPEDAPASTAIAPRGIRAGARGKRAAGTEQDTGGRPRSERAAGKGKENPVARSSVPTALAFTEPIHQELGSEH